MPSWWRREHNVLSPGKKGNVHRLRVPFVEKASQWSIQAEK
jgi:hypothetical protein